MYRRIFMKCIDFIRHYMYILNIINRYRQFHTKYHEIYTGTEEYMKKAIGVILLSCLAIASTGCMRVYGNYVVNDDGTVTVTAKQSISKEFSDQMGEPQPNAVLETLEDGKQYYSTTDTQTGSINDISNDTDMTLTKDIFYYHITPSTNDNVNNTDYDLANAISQSIYVKLSVTLTSDIVDTNANITSETSGKTATFDTTFIGASWYAYTAQGKALIDADTTAPVIQGITDGGSYATIPEITFSDDTGAVITTLNGKEYSALNIKNGKNTITATDLKGNSTTLTFYKDTEAPTIKGIKNGNIYTNNVTFYVKDKVDLKKVTVDGKTQKLTKSKLVKKGKYKDYYKITIKKKGNHKIISIDSAGNKKTIKIRIE